MLICKKYFISIAFLKEYSEIKILCQAGKTFSGFLLLFVMHMRNTDLPKTRDNGLLKKYFVPLFNTDKRNDLPSFTFHY